MTCQKSYSGWNISTALLLSTRHINPSNREIGLTCHGCFLALFITVIYQWLKIVSLIICSRTFPGLDWFAISSIILWFLPLLFFLSLSSVYSQKWLSMVQRPFWLVHKVVKTRFHEALLIWRYLSCLNNLSFFCPLVSIYILWCPQRKKSLSFSKNWFLYLLHRS